MKYKKLKLLRGLRIFRKTTKFKKFTFGVSKNTSIRKTYIKKKRVSSNVVFQHLARHWSYFFLKKKTIESFMYFLFAFAYTVPVPHLPYIFKKVTHKNFTDKLFFHSALISKKVVYNNAIFRKDKTYFKYFKGHMRFQESAFLTFHALPTDPSTFRKLLPWSILNGNALHNPQAVISNAKLCGNYQLQLSTTLLLVLKTLLQVILELRKI